MGSFVLVKQGRLSPAGSYCMFDQFNSLLSSLIADKFLTYAIRRTEYALRFWNLDIDHICVNQVIQGIM